MMQIWIPGEFFLYYLFLIDTYVVYDKYFSILEYLVYEEEK